MLAHEVRTTVETLTSAMAARDRRRVNLILRDLLEARAPLGRQWTSLAQVLLRNGEVVAAIAASNLAVTQTGNDARVRFAHAALLAQAGRLDDAERAIQSLDPSAPSVAEHGYLSGTLALNRGDTGRAVAELLRAVKAEPGRGQAWLALAMADKAHPRLLDALSDASPSMTMAPTLERAAWHFAVGKATLDLGRPEAAFESVGRGAMLMRALRPYAHDTDSEGAQRAVEGWTPFEPASDVARPIFVTGLPRSGTTLVEQILATHSELAGGDELSIGTLIAEEVGGTSAAALARHCAAGGSIEALRSLYLHLLDQRFPGTKRVVDKGLGASRYLGLIATIFPGAPIVWLRRDPVDCAWSAYRSWFVRGAAWSWSLEDIAHHFRLEDELHQQWQQLLGTRMLTVDYASLVEDSETNIRGIAEHCGLSFEPAMLYPERTKRAVSTNSAMQVREPINAKGIGSADGLGNLLDPFRNAYFGSAT